MQSDWSIAEFLGLIFQIFTVVCGNSVTNNGALTSFTSHRRLTFTCFVQTQLQQLQVSQLSIVVKLSSEDLSMNSTVILLFGLLLTLYVVTDFFFL